MKVMSFFLVSICLAAVILGSSLCRAADITAVASGNWSDTNTWSTQTVPSTNDDADIPGGITVTVDTNVTIQFIYDAGTVVMAPNSTLIVTDDHSISATISLQATAAGSTVMYTCNPYDAKVCDYYDLILNNTNWALPPTVPFTPPYQDFNNFASASVSVATPMTVYGDMTLMGHIKVQEANVPGVPINVNGNLTIGPGCAWDCSSGTLMVKSNLYLGGMLEDLDGANGTNNIGGDVIETGPSTFSKTYSAGVYTNGWYLGDVVTWGVGGGLTNNGVVYGLGYASIHFNGAGSIAGSNTLTIPTISFNGSYTIADTIILTTNNADFNGTLTFDLARTNQIVLRSSPAGPNNQITYYSGNLVVINSGAPPTSGKSYQLFSAAQYNGAFASTLFPGLTSGLSWMDNLAVNGSITVTGGGGGRPVITLQRNGNQLTLSWDSTTFPGYSVQAQTNSAGLKTNWAPAGSTTTSPFQVNVNPSNPSVFYRLSNP